MKTGYMGMHLELPGDVGVWLSGNHCKVWLAHGLPTFEGSIDQLEVAHPDVLAQLIKLQVVKVS